MKRCVAGELLRSLAGAFILPLACTAAADTIHQSPLVPSSVQAAETASMVWVMLAGGTLVFCVMAWICVHALRRRTALPSQRTTRALLLGGGVIFPAVVVVALVLYAIVVSNRLQDKGDGDVLRVEIVGEMWWWRVHYLDTSGRTVVATANELHVPVSRAVMITLRSADVIHSLWLPGLAGMLDMIPGRVNTLKFTATTPGDLRGQCTEFCGTQHAKMGIDVRVHPPADFEAWLTGQQALALPPDSPEAKRGSSLFESACASCHTIRGTAATGTLGPDLTHIGSRRTLAASSLPNNAGTLAAWIVGSQHLKPGNRMPSFESLPGADLNALVAYMVTLR